MANNTDWLNISQMTGGTGETALSLTALTNNSLQPKTATITARNTQYNVSGTTTVTIQGFQPILTLSRSTLRFDSTGGTATFTVYSNTAWTINFPTIVHSYSTSAGTGDTEVTVALAPNPDEVAKIDTGIVKDVFNVNQLYLTIVQESFVVELYVEPTDDIVFKNTGSTTAITIDSNADWEVEYPSWVTPSVASGESGTTTVTFTAGENGPTDRSGEITVYAGSKAITINVFQPFYIPPYITVTPSSWEFLYSEDGKTFIVDSYPGWTAEIVSSGETVWTSDAYMEAVFDIPSAMTMPLWVGNSGSTTGVYLGPIVHYGSSITFPSSGTYVIRYEMLDNGTTPVLQGNQYLKEITLSDKVGAIQSSAFTGCTELSSVTIGSGLTRAGAAAFSGCSSLSDITITAPTAPSVCANTFYGVASAGTLNYPQGSDYSSWLQDNPYYLGYYWGFDPSNYYKVATITYNVTSTTVPTRILNRSNYYCAIVDANGTVTKIDNNSFTGYTFSSTGKQYLDLYYTKTGHYSDSFNTAHTYVVDISGLTNVTDIVLHSLPEKNETDGLNNYTRILATSSNTATALTINCRTYPNDRPSITQFRSVKKLIYGESADYLIPAGGFTFTPALTDVFIMSDNITTIPESYFKGASLISALTLGENIQSIGRTSFSGCASLTSITCYATTAPTIKSSSFYAVGRNGILKYPQGSNYSTWLSNSSYYLGYYGWTRQEI